MFRLNGTVWRVVFVEPSNPGLIDRTNTLRLATTDPVSHIIRISSAVVPPLLDKVLLHEVAHAITISYGLLDFLGIMIPDKYRISVEEWAVQLVENYSIEALAISVSILNRPVCIKHQCVASLARPNFLNIV